MEAVKKAKGANRIFRRSIHDIYVNIASVFVISLLGFLILFPGLFLLPVMYGAVYGIFTLFPTLAGMLYAMSQRLANKPFKYIMFFKGFKMFYFQSFGLGILYIIAGAIPAASWWYYSNAGTGFSLFIAVFQTFFCLCIYLVLAYSFPIMVNEEKGMADCIKASMRLFMNNVLYTIAGFIAVAAISVLLIASTITIPLLLGGIVSIIMLDLYYNLMLRYVDGKDE